MSVVAVGLGSNLGNRLLNLRTSVRYMKEAGSGGKLEVRRTSDVFETAPWGVTDQPYFLNACLLAESDLPPEELLALLKGVENKMGRTTAAVSRRWGERTIDLDILTMESLVYDTADLHVPHIDMHRRSFVLTPLVQILPGWVHPVMNRSVAELAMEMRDNENLRICRI